MKEQIITYAMKLLASFVAYFAPSAPLIHAVLIMVLIDLITGVWAATTRAEKINSNGLRRTVRKMIGYVILIISGHIVDVTLLSGQFASGLYLLGLHRTNRAPDVYEKILPALPATMYCRIYGKPLKRR